MKITVRISLLALAVLSCDRARPIAIAADADPFLYNGAAPIRLPVHATDANRQRVESPIAARSDQPDIAVIEDNTVRCLRAGDTRITASLGNLQTAFQLQCRPIASFGPPQGLDLVLGEPPVPIPVIAYDSAGISVTSLRYSASTEDTAVIAIVAGSVVPRSLGPARIRLDFGGTSTVVAGEVVAPEVRDTVYLAAGEYRSWPLGPGRYISKFTILGSSGTSPPLAWRSTNANCAFESTTRAHMHCGLKEPGAVVLFAAQPTRAAIRIDRRAH